MIKCILQSDVIWQLMMIIMMNVVLDDDDDA